MRRALRVLGAAAMVAAGLMAGEEGHATFPGGNGRILVSLYDRGTSEHELVTMDVDGGGRTTLTADFRGEIYAAAWSPDGARIAFLNGVYAPDDGEAPSRWSLWVMNGDGSGKRRLKRFVGFYPDVTWAADGSEVVYTRSDRFAINLYAVPATGGAERRLTALRRALAFTPVASPDGRAIAFTHVEYAPERYAVYVVNADGTELRRVAPYGSQLLDWSPDGSRILFERRSTLFTVRPDGAGVTRFEWERGALGVRWSPDGDRVLAIGEEWPNADIAYANPDGTCLTPIPGTDDAQAAAWQPVPGGPRSGPVRCADVGVSAAFDRERAVTGGTVVLRVRVENGGTDPAEGVVLEHRPGRAFAVVRAEPARGSCSGDAILRCELGTLAPGETIEIRLVLRVRGEGYLDASVTARTASDDPDETNDRAGASLLACSHMGTPGADRIVGTPGRDVICAGGGADVVFGRGGPDTIEAGAGRDIVHAGAGRDFVSGGAGADRIWGGRGRDELFAYAGRDVVLGGAGADVLQGGPGRDRMFGGRGDDDLDAYDAYSDLVDGGPGRDSSAATAIDRLVNVENAGPFTPVTGRKLAFLAPGPG